MHSKPRTPYQIFLQSPDLISQSLTLTPTPIQPTTLAHLKSSLFPFIPSSSYFTFNGKRLDDSAPLLPSVFPPFSTLILTCRLLGGGGDGGATGAESRDCYLNMYAEKKPDKVDPNEQRLSKWLNCALSGEPLMAPCVVDGLGNVFNKEALVRALLEKNLPKEFGHIKGLKDMVGIELSRINGDGDVRFQCPISGLEFNGKYRFYALKGCGHVLSAKALKEVKSAACLVCHGEFKEEDKIAINGSEEEVKVLRQRLEEERAKEKESKMKKAKKVKNGEEPVGLSAGKRVGGDANVENGSGGGKRFKAADVMPKNATKEVYASIFTSSKKKTGLRETFSCRSLPLGPSRPCKLSYHNFCPSQEVTIPLNSEACSLVTQCSTLDMVSSDDKRSRHVLGFLQCISRNSGSSNWERNLVWFGLARSSYLQRLVPKSSCFVRHKEI